jgi:hypothetical protein
MTLGITRLKNPETCFFYPTQSCDSSATLQRLSLQEDTNAQLVEHHITPSFTVLNGLMAVLIAVLYIVFSSLMQEPNRQKLMALILAGAGAAYLGGGLGPLEFVFCTVMTVLAYFGTKHYYFIGIGWLLHTGWDITHHFYGNPIVPFSPSSSAGCAICDAILAIWFFCNAPGIFGWFKQSKSISTPS